jgi:hypothetical protein
MAVNLTPKADATLVAQSYRMGMAGVPQDLSRTFDGISKSYSSAMGEVGRAGAIVGEQVGQLAGEGLKIAIQNIKDNNTGLDDLSDTYSLDARQSIVDELQKLKKGNNLFIDDDGDPETNKVLNPRYIPFSKKGKEAREEFRRKKNIAIKDLKAMQDGTFMNATAIEQNAIVQDGSSQQEWVMNNAIASKGYPLKEGDYAGVSAKSFYKDVDGEQRQHFMLVKDGKEVMIDDNGAIVDVAEGKEGVHTAATDIGSLIKKKDANVAPNLIKIQEAVYNNSLKGLDFQANITKSAITNSIKTNDQAITAFHSNELGLDISYAQALEGENEITGEMFLGLLDLNKDGKVDASETSFAKLDGDFSTPENIIKLKKAMLDPNNSKSRDIFANWATSELTKVHDSGNKVYVRNQPKGRGSTSPGSSNAKYGGYGSYNVKTSPKSGFGEPKTITHGTATIRRNALDSFERVGGEHENYTWDTKSKKWIDGSGEKYTSYDVATIEGLIRLNEGRADFEGDIETEINDNNLKNQGLAPSAALKLNGDDAVSGELNRIFGMRMGESDYYFHPFSRDVYRGTFRPGNSDSGLTNDVMLYDKSTKRPAVDPATGEPYRFKTGDKFKDEQLKILNDLMVELGYVKKVTNTQYEDN